jgi:predicted phosphoribosyltransferase
MRPVRRFTRSSTTASILAGPTEPTPAERVFTRYADRRHAGRVLGDWVACEITDAAVVVALAGTGVPVAFEVAAALRAPLDVIAVHAVTVPRLPAARLGAVVDDGTVLVDADAVRGHGVRWAELDDVIACEIVAAAHRAEAYRHGRPPLQAEGRIAVVVDDGIETGMRMSAAVRAIRRRLPSRLVVATPLIARHAVRRLAAEADAVIAPLVPPVITARDHWYTSSEPGFGNTDDALDALPLPSAVSGNSVTPA